MALPRRALQTPITTLSWQFARFSNESTPATFGWSGMTPGDTYLVQFWVNDGRNSTVNARTETLTGGANTSAALAYGSGNNGPGQFIIGTFVADKYGFGDIDTESRSGYSVRPNQPFSGT